MLILKPVMKNSKDIKIVKEQLVKWGFQPEASKDNSFSFLAAGVPFELVVNHEYDPEQGLSCTLVHLSRVYEGCDSFIMRLAVEDAEHTCGGWVSYREEKGQVGFYAFPTVLHPQATEVDLPETVQSIIECRKEIQARYLSMRRLIQLSKEEETDLPTEILFSEEDHPNACEEFAFWGPSLCTGDIEEVLDAMGMQHEVVDLIDDIMPRKPILFWTGSEMYLIQDEGNRPVLYAKRIIDIDRSELFGPICRTIAHNISLTEYKLEHNVCTVFTRLPEDTDYKNLGDRLRICTARLTQFLDQLADYSPEARKIEATHEQMRKYFIYESVKNDLTKQ